ncbi:MAG: helix-turn-helix domain-containing protein [Lentisphaeria bacterium]|nr:helix-turn-helix domain-containing protein [Lentisphaeria bacterium]
MSVEIKHELTGGQFYRETNLPLRVQLVGEKKVLWHRHRDFYELVIVCNGSALNVNRVRSETIFAGNVFLMPDQTAHRYTDFNNFRYYNILFHPSLLETGVNAVHLESLAGYHTLFDFQFSGENRCSRMLTVDSSVLSRLVPRLTALRNELAARRPGWRESAYFMFMQILVDLLRESTPAGGSARQNVFPIGNAIRMMERDCTASYPVRKLADAVGMSVSCFRHNFTRITGLPPREYLLMLRLRKAVVLLNGPAPIGEIAAQTGFPDSNYFSRIIRSRLGFSPREIRQRYNSRKLSPEDLLERLAPPSE